MKQKAGPGVIAAVVVALLVVLFGLYKVFLGGSEPTVQTDTLQKLGQGGEAAKQAQEQYKAHYTESGQHKPQPSGFNPGYSAPTSGAH